MTIEEINQRIRELDQLIAQQPTHEELIIERGNLYWKLQDWKHSLEDYDRAISLNPHSPAVEMKRMAMQVIEYFYKDRYNP